MFKELSKKSAEDLLNEQSIGRLGCVLRGGEPYVVPVSYLFEGGSIYIHSLEGQKIEAMRAHPKVCLQVDDIENHFEWQSVIAFGEFEEITDEEKQDEILQELFLRFPDLTPVEDVGLGKGKKLVIFRIKINRITGLAEA
ncbi:MAG TPA: pyridoxamine 5'-phosphate oxidase family protein [Pyrinomonadaceae bacterium]|nr:pyridoxamine 5'-phosphate oxidase family protein [Pyrinomonadaceae bacterium]